MKLAPYWVIYPQLFNNVLREGGDLDLIMYY